MQPSPDGFVIQSDLTGDLPYGVAVHQSQVEHLTVGLVVDTVFDQRRNLIVQILRAR